MRLSENILKRFTDRNQQPKTPSDYGMATRVVLAPETPMRAYRQTDGSIVYLPNIDFE